VTASERTLPLRESKIALTRIFFCVAVLLDYIYTIKTSRYTDFYSIKCVYYFHIVKKYYLFVKLVDKPISFRYPICETNFSHIGINMQGSKKVNSISRAASIMRCLGDGTNRITQIALKTKLSNSTVHRLIKTLQAEGFVEQDPLTLKYSLGPLLIALTLNPLTTHASIVSCAIEEMETLRQISGETVGLVIRLGLQRLQLEELPSERVVKYSVGKGFAEPICLAASSKVLLSEIPFENREKLLNIIENKELSITQDFRKVNLLKEVGLAEKNGYAVSFGEIVPGASSIAVPVKGYVIPVAICIFGPMERFDLQTMMKILPELRRASKNITKNIEKNISKQF